jgi:hypothetical protein
MIIQREIMNYFNDLVIRTENIGLIMSAQLDKKIWNLLIERVSKILKNKIDKSHLGKNYENVINDLYTISLEDLRTNFQFFRNVYSIIADYEIKDCNVLVSNILTFMGDIKKLKLTLNKKFLDFQDIVKLDGETGKDANDALRFFNYALNNNPLNTRIYSNIGFLYREFLQDKENSVYWFIRGMACANSELRRVKENLEKDFNSIRKIFMQKDYNVNSDVGLIKYDLNHLPVLFYRIVGILYTSIDVDKFDGLMRNFKTIIEKVLVNYHLVGEEFKFKVNFSGLVEQMAILSLFSFHYNLNNVSDYTTETEKIIYKEQKIEIYSHNIMKEIKNLTNSQEEIRKSFKLSLILLKDFVRSVCLNINQENQTFVVKFLLIIFYWLSLNYDVFQLLLDEDTNKYLKFLNFVIQEDLKKESQVEVVNTEKSSDINNDNSSINYDTNQFSIKKFDENFENYILPIETTFFGFIPINRFFSLHKKSKVLKVEDFKDIININKVTLIKFLDSFNLLAENSEEIASTYYKKSENLSITEKILTDDTISESTNELKSKLFNPKNIISLNVKKSKPLILLDASNIAMRHGDRNFSCKGIKIVMDFFKRSGHEVLSFLPEYLFNKASPGKKYRVVPDDIDFLKSLYADHQVIQTPAQDYDDSYCIQYAKQKNAFIVTNDMYRDYLEKIKDNRQRETEKIWMKEKLISFSFFKDEFLPNPDSAFFKEFSFQDYSENIENSFD